MIAKSAEKYGAQNLGIGTDLCQDQPDSIVTWMRNGRWSKETDFGEGSASAPGFPDHAKAYWTKVLAQMVKTPTWKQTIAKYNWDDAFQVEGLNETLDKKQAVVTDILTKLGMTKKK